MQKRKISSAESWECGERLRERESIWILHGILHGKYNSETKTLSSRCVLEVRASIRAGKFAQAPATKSSGVDANLLRERTQVKAPSHALVGCTLPDSAYN